jgi:GT2 family glycosyltransferase
MPEQKPISEVAVITPLWNRADLTMRFYRSHVSRGLADGAVYVAVDNGSHDATPSILRNLASSFRDFVTIKNEVNRGFGPANNQGYREVESEVVVFLSNDVEVNGDYLSPILAVARDGLLIGGELIDWDSGWNSFDGRVVPYIAGWCVAATRATIECLGGWDERFVPCDYEDVDLSKSAVEAGLVLKPLSLPLRHLSGQSALSLQGGRARITLQNRGLFMKKWGYEKITGRGIG